MVKARSAFGSHTTDQNLQHNLLSCTLTVEPERPRPLAKKPKTRQCLSLDALNLNWPKRKRNRHERPGHAISWRSLCSVQRSSFQFSSVQFDSNRYQCDFKSSSVSVWVSPRVSVCNFAVSILNWARPPHCIYA